MTRHLSILCLLAAFAVALLCFLFPSFGSVSNPVKVSISPQIYHFNLNVGWTPITNPIAAGYYVYCNGQQYGVAGRGSVGMTISNLVGPRLYVLTARAYALSGAVSAPSDEVDYAAPIQTFDLSCNSTGYVIQASVDMRSWVSVPGLTVTNSGANSYFRAISKWP